LIGVNVMPTRNDRHRRARDKGLRHNLTLQIFRPSPPRPLAPLSTSVHQTRDGHFRYR
jgi:hypothetical protein